MKHLTLKGIVMTMMALLPILQVSAAITVRGVVKDAANEPVVGANVLVKGSTQGTITDFDGNYELQVDNDQAVLVVSYLGMITQELKASQAQGKAIVLKEDTEVLDEVVVVGFGTQKKESLTGSVAVVDSKQFVDKGALSSPLEAMQGQVPGVIITRSSTAPGDESWSMSLRGSVSMNSTEPLIIIDGIAFGSVNELRNLNANDIENISFLKDGAAAIYGSRAAGGVVLITTKQGKAGKVKVEYSGSVTTKMPGLQPKLMSNTQWADGVMQTLENDNNTGHVWYTYAQLMKKYNNMYIDLSQSANPFGTAAFTDVSDFVFAETDWLGGLFGNAISTGHNLSISGGGEKNTFRISLGYNYDDSNMRYGKNNNHRANIRLNDTYHFTDKISLTSQVAYARQEQVAPSALDQALNIGQLPQPGLPMRALNGKPYAWGTWGSSVGKVEEGGDNKLSVSNISINEIFNYDITSWLTMNVSLGYQNNFAQRNTTTNSITYYNVTGEKVTRVDPLAEKSSYNQTQSRKDYLSASGYFNAHKKWADAHFTGLTVGAQYEYEQYNYFGVKAEAIQPGLEIVNGTGDITISAHDKYEYALASIFARANYDYKGRYLIEGNFRLDGSSKFKPENRWKAFGGVSVGWRMSEEEWLKTNWLTNLKLRYSYAEVGNQSGIGYYDGIQLYNLNSANGPYLGSELSSTITTNGTFASSARTWERIRNYNAAIDFGFRFKGNNSTHDINGTAEVFHKENTNMLVNITLPAILGDKAPSGNVGSFRDYGAEGILTYMGKSGDINWHVGGTFTWAHNVLTKYEGTSVKSSGYTSTQVGYSLNSLFGLRFAGKIQDQDQLEAYVGKYYDGNGIGMPTNLRVGDNMYSDENGDGILDFNDYVYLGSSDPEISYSFNFGFGWKEIIDINVVFQGAGNRYIYRGNDNNWTVPYRALHINNTVASIGNTWTPEHTDAYYAPYTLDGNINNYNYQASSLTAQDGTYIRLKDITLRLSMPRKWLANQNAVSAFSIYVTGSDLWESTKIVDGWDPESKITKSGTTLYPFTRNVTVGVNLSF